MYPKHKCPLCGKEVVSKTNESGKYKEKYLDGQHKMPFDVFISMYHLCPRCGLVYVFYGTGTLFISETVKDIVMSEQYQKISHNKNIPNNLKLLMLIEQIAKAREIIGQDINWLYLRYYEEQRDLVNVDKYLQKVINDIETGLFFHTNLYEGETGCKFNGKMVMSKNVVLIDLNRRLKRFNKAQEYINLVKQTANYNANHPLQQYVAVQQKLIENKIHRHI